MNIHASAFLASALLATAGPAIGQSSEPQDSTNKCAMQASDAVKALPTPLTKWAQLICTPRGEIITGKAGWVWVEPSHRALVIIPSMKIDRTGTPVEGDAGYFTKVDVKQLSGDELDGAFKAFGEGSDASGKMPQAYRLEVSTSSGDELRLFFFDYDSYGWGMSCGDNDCERASRFVMINVKDQEQAEAKRHSI